MDNDRKAIHDALGDLIDLLVTARKPIRQEVGAACVYVADRAYGPIFEKAEDFEQMLKLIQKELADAWA